MQNVGKIGLAILISLGPAIGAATSAEAHQVQRSVEPVACSLVDQLPVDHHVPAVVAGNPGLGRAPSDGLRVIWRGDVIRIKATGQIHAGGFLGFAGEHGPDGNGEPAPPGGLWPLPGASKFSLVGGLNDTTQGRFSIGSGPLCLRWNGTDHHDSLFDQTFLNLSFNDDWTHDNSGQFNVEVDIFWCNRWSAC